MLGGRSGPHRRRAGMRGWRKLEPACRKRCESRGEAGAESREEQELPPQLGAQGRPLLLTCSVAGIRYVGAECLDPAGS